MGQDTDATGQVVFPDIGLYRIRIRRMLTDSDHGDIFFQGFQGFYQKQQILPFLDAPYI